MAFEASLLAAFGAMLCWGIADFLIQRSTRQIGNLESLAFIGLTGAIGLFPFIVGEINIVFLSENILLLLLLAVIAFCTALINFEALKTGKLSVVDVIIELELPVTIILAFLFFRETLSLPQFLVIFLIFVGILLISLSSFSRDWVKNLEKGALLAAITAIGLGIVNFLTAAASKQISPLIAIWFPWTIIAVISLFFISRRQGVKKFFSDCWRHKKTVFPMGVIDTLAWVFFATAVFSSQLSITTAITESYPAIAIMLGVWINKERIFFHQAFGAVLTIASSATLAFLI